MSALPPLLDPVRVPHIVKGQLVEGADHTYGAGPHRFMTPALRLNDLVWSRQEPGPAFDVPLAEIMEVLVATGDLLNRDPDGLLHEACEHLKQVSTIEAGVLERSYALLGKSFTRAAFEAQIDSELGGPEVLEGWKEVRRVSGKPGRVRAFPPRLVHVLAGNAPGVAAMSIVRGALVKGVHLLKLPSNDLFSATAILRVMAKAAPGHPLLRCFSAVYWRGGDAAVESQLLRPQYFDKLVAWGGESALRSAKQYIGPGFELVAFDPKTSISMIGREAFVDDPTLRQVAAWAGEDATPMNQGACVSSRIQYVEGSLAQVDRYCALLHEQLGVERTFCSVLGEPVTGELRDQIETLGQLEPDYRVWGRFDGSGIVIRSDGEPVDFYPDRKVVNVVRVDALEDALHHVNVATQTVGLYPPARKTGLRDALASAGVQRVVALGGALGPEAGLAHDGFFPLHRFVRWVNDED